jgi:ribosomal-protein-alanine N-acetyltransferase
MYLRFETERLYINPTVINDSDLIYQMMNSPKFKQFVGNRNIQTIEDATNYIKDRMLPQLREFGYSNYSIIRKSDKLKIGVCGLYNREGIEGIDIGFGILPDFEGNGYAFEAAQRLIRAAFEDFKINTIKAITSKENFASQKILEKLEMTQIGAMHIPNDNKEVYLYEIGKRDFKEFKTATDNETF